MSPEDRERLERDVRAQCRDGAFDRAATTAIRGYGPEIYGFLLGFLRTEQDAAEVFALANERIWRGLERFDWTCSLRTWAYTIARNASINHRDAARRHAKALVPLDEASEVSRLSEQVRTATRSYLRSETKSRVAVIRESLSTEEQMLLSLRIDRELAWDDLVTVMRDGPEPLSAESMRRESAKMRKRFQSLKTKLAELARREGLLGKGR